MTFFYDGSDVTPFLPRNVILNLIRRVVDSRLPSETYFFLPLLSQLL
jgi:hypothetical protein